MNNRWRSPLVILAAAISLTGCYGSHLSGNPPPSFDTATVGVCPLLCAIASVTQITPDIAVTARHARYVTLTETVPARTRRFGLAPSRRASARHSRASARRACHPLWQQ